MPFIRDIAIIEIILVEEILNTKKSIKIIKTLAIIESKKALVASFGEICGILLWDLLCDLRQVSADFLRFLVKLLYGLLLITCKLLFAALKCILITH